MPVDVGADRQTDGQTHTPVDLAAHPAHMSVDVGAALVLQQVVVHAERRAAQVTHVPLLQMSPPAKISIR